MLTKNTWRYKSCCILEGQRCRRQGRVLGSQASHRAVWYPPGIESHRGGRLFLYRLWRAIGPGSATVCRGLSCNVRPPPRKTWFLQNLYPLTSAPSGRHATAPRATSGGTPLKHRLPATSALRATSGELKLGTSMSRFHWRRSS